MAEDKVENRNIIQRTREKVRPRGERGKHQIKSGVVKKADQFMHKKHRI